ncbi:MAG: type I restriction endonuclease subunit R [Chitinophagaceae bacterium]|nr:type I restriction endonuclease subunit R [Chitinophagaceae bacterium]
MSRLHEAHIETLTLELLQDAGWQYLHGLSIAPGAQHQERTSFEQVLLTGRLLKAAERINAHIPAAAVQQAVKQAERLLLPDILHNNEAFHSLLVEKVKIPYHQDGYERSHEVALIDFDHWENNEFLAINQYTIVENQQNKRPDILLFVNGIPLVLIELKNAGDEHATLHNAFQQIQTYKATIPSLFTYNAICIISDGHECRAGSVSAAFTRYMAWKTADGRKEASRFMPQIEVMVRGMLGPETLLDIVRNFIVFEKTRREDAATGLVQITTEKKLAAYHQYYAVNNAVLSTLRAVGVGVPARGEPFNELGNRKGGVVWHTQGSGKSLSMVFYAGKLVTHLDMENPTIVVITDRNDLDDQLFDTFAASRQLLRQDPVQAESRDHLKELLKVASGGIVFTTIQKFLPQDGSTSFDTLSDRKNIVVIADEAHRTQYGFEAVARDVKDAGTREVIGQRIAYGFAKYMRDALPHATYIGFTGTPIESTDVNTPQVFGQYVDVYDISQAVEDGATVRIYYESRLSKIELTAEGRALVDEFDKAAEAEELSATQKAKARWAKLEAIIGHPNRIRNIARDIVTHFEARNIGSEPKGMIVAMSRRIAVDLYREIIALRPGWDDPDLNKGVIKVVMTASSADGPEMQRHHTSKGQRKMLAARMKDEHDPLKLVIVRDMWLTGFDAPCLKTLYIDKPMKGHSLMQAIARVNRIFKDVKGGLVVDYLGIGTDLKKALSFYADSGGKGNPAEDISQAVAIMLEKMEIVQQLFAQPSLSQPGILAEEAEAYHKNETRFNYERFFSASPRQKLSIILQAEEHILGLPEGRERFIREVTMLGQAFALCLPQPSAVELADEIAFFQAVKARLVKFEVSSNTANLEMDTAVKQLVDKALTSDTVIDIFDAAGIQKPDISILSEQFLLEVKNMRHKNLAIELLKKLLNNEIKSRTRTNFVKSRQLLEMLESAIRRYQNNLLTTAEILQELIELAREINASDTEAERLGLTKDEVAFYNALETNDSAVKILGDEKLRMIAREIAEKVRTNTTLDWSIRESARAQLLVAVKRTLTIHGYPPDKQPRAIETVMEQAELLADNWHGQL